MTTSGALRERLTATLELLYDGNVVLVQADDVVVGRTSRCTVRVAHPLVSREHCRIELRSDGLFIEDLGSVNGTWLNGNRLAARTQARAGDRLGLGRDGAVLVVQRAQVGGIDVTRPARQEDLHTMVAGDPRAQGVVASVEVATEALPSPQEPARIASPDPPTAPIPVVDSVRTAEVPRSLLEPATVLPTPAPVPSAPDGRTGFAKGFAVGFLIGLALVAALAKSTRAFDRIRSAAPETRGR